MALFTGLFYQSCLLKMNRKKKCSFLSSTQKRLNTKFEIMGMRGAIIPPSSFKVRYRDDSIVTQTAPNLDLDDNHYAIKTETYALQKCSRSGMLKAREHTRTHMHTHTSQCLQNT